MTDWDRAARYAFEHQDELREWVIKTKNYGGAGALNGPVMRPQDREKWIANFMIKRAAELLREEDHGRSP